MTEARSARVEEGTQPGSGRGWLRATGLLVAAMAMSVFHPTVLVAIPFLAFVAVFGMRGVGVAILAALAMVVAATGSGAEPVWWVERAWAVVVAGFFVALSIRRPESSFSSRALGTVGAGAGVMAVLLALRPEAWSALDWMVRDRMRDGVTTALEAIRLFRGGEAVPTSLVAAVYETVEIQGDLFPATVALSSMAALGVAWWGYRRITAGDAGALRPLGGFRFNDHLVWLFIGGLVLTVTRWSDGLGRFGENVFVFMAALYAVRGAAVILFLSGGLSLFGWVVLAVGLVFVPPLVLTGALVIGIGDTWLDLRSRFRDAAV